MNAQVLLRPELAELCKNVKSVDHAKDIYLSSQAAVDSDQPEARRFLDALAFRLGLPPGMGAIRNRSL